MRSFRLIATTPDGSRVWINIPQILKMVQFPDGRYFVYMVNGESYEVDRRTAGYIEDFEIAD